MACEKFSFAGELFYILDCGRIYLFFWRLEQNQFNQLYDSEENASPMFRETKVGKLVL